MTKAEQSIAILEAQKRFYAWEPPGLPFQQFRCLHQSSCMVITEVLCEARARNPELYREDCGGKVHGRYCPRWRHYYKAVRLSDRQAHKTLLDSIKPQPLRRK